MNVFDTHCIFLFSGGSDSDGLLFVPRLSMTQTCCAMLTTLPPPFRRLMMALNLMKNGSFTPEKWLSHDSLMPETDWALQVPIRNLGTLCLLMKHSLESKPVLSRKTGTLCFMMKHSWNQALKWLSFCLHSQDFLPSCDQKDSLKSYQTAKVSKPLQPWGCPSLLSSHGKPWGF